MLIHSASTQTPELRRSRRVRGLRRHPLESMGDEAEPDATPDPNAGANCQLRATQSKEHLRTAPIAGKVRRDGESGACPAGGVESEPETSSGYLRSYGRRAFRRRVSRHRSDHSSCRDRVLHVLAELHNDLQFVHCDVSCSRQSGPGGGRVDCRGRAMARDLVEDRPYPEVAQICRYSGDRVRLAGVPRRGSACG